MCSSPNALTIDPTAFPMDVRNAQQSVHRLDVVLDKGTSRAVAPKMGQCGLATDAQPPDDLPQGMSPRPMADDGVAL